MVHWKELMQQQDHFAREIRSKKAWRFPVNPYVQCFQNLTDPSTWHLYFDDGASGGSVWMHLIVGTEKALLVDTGYGIGDLAALVKELTGRPVLVVNTHWHSDHTGGDAQFSSVFLHPLDQPYLRRAWQKPEQRLLPANLSYERQDKLPYRETALLPMSDAFSFALGGRTVEVIHLPGHSAGHCMLFDTKSRFLFSGDAILSTPTLVIDGFPSVEHPKLVTVEALAKGLRAQSDRLREVAAIYPSHGRLGLSPGHIAAVQHCAEAIVAEPEKYEVYDYLPMMPGKIRCVEDAMIVYSLNRVKGEH